MFGFIPPEDPEARDEGRRFPANLALDVIAARRLTEIRERLGLTQSEVARAAKSLGFTWTRNTIHAIERFGLGGRPDASGGGEAPAAHGSANPQSGTRRLTLMELVAVPRILEEACRVRGGDAPRIHPLWFVRRETFERMRAELADPEAERRTWPDPPGART